MTKKQRIQQAIEAGYWITKDHGWQVGRGTHPPYEFLYGGQRFAKKAEAQDAMVMAYFKTLQDQKSS